MYIIVVHVHHRRGAAAVRGEIAIGSQQLREKRLENHLANLV